MQGVAHGNIKAKGLSAGKASEFTTGVDYHKLPKRSKSIATRGH